MSAPDERPMTWLRNGHRFLETCPGCGEQNLSATGLDRLAYVFTTCTCGDPEYPHLVEQLWHRAHLSEVTAALSVTARREAMADVLNALNREIRKHVPNAPAYKLTYRGGLRRARELADGMLGEAMAAEQRVQDIGEVTR